MASEVGTQVFCVAAVVNKNERVFFFQVFSVIEQHIEKMVTHMRHRGYSTMKDSDIHNIEQS